MKTTIKKTNISVPVETEQYAIEKITSVERFLPDVDADAVLAEIELEKSTHHKRGEVYRCEVNLTIEGTLLRAEERGESITAAIDKVKDELHRDVKRMKEKQRTKFLRSARKLARRMKFFRFGKNDEE